MAPPVNNEVRLIVLGPPDVGAGKLSFEYFTQYHPADGRTYTSYLLLTNGHERIRHQEYKFCDVQKEENGFSCRLQMVAGPYKDYWLDSKDGYLQAWGSSSERWRFVDKGSYYQWQQVSSKKFVRVLTEEVATRALYVRAMVDEPRPDDESAQFNVISW